MKRIRTKHTLAAITATVAVAGALVGSNAAFALTTQQTTTQQTRMQTIISKGDQEISRRLTSLNNLTATVNAATRLTANDKATLNNEITTEISGLTALKTKLDSETTLEGVRTDAQQIYTNYRVYVLVLPKARFVKFADSIQAVDSKLTTLASKLQSRLTTEQQAGKDVSALQATLADMNSKTSAAQAAASQIESGVINLQPSDYNSNHQILGNDITQLKAAHANNKAAFVDAKSIISSLKSLKE